MTESKARSSCDYPCTRAIKLLEDREVPPNVGISVPPYTEVDGYLHVNIFVRFTQEEFDEEPVDLGVIFAFDGNGTMGARCYVNLEENLAGPQTTNFISVSGAGTWHGAQHGISSYLTRFSVMGPYLQVFVYNRDDKPRKVSVWAYLVG